MQDVTWLTFTCMSLIFRSISLEHNYLHIQVDTLCEDTSSTDKAIPGNMNELVKIGEGLLDEPVSRLNIDNGMLEPVQNGGTTEQALTKYF
ncbi:hypothetical protein LguiB_009254 [Lonicera macranthoides]